MTIFDFYPQFTDSNGEPLAGGRVSFYERDSFTLTKAVYLNSNRTVLAQSIQPLNATGRYEQGILYPADGAYNIVVERKIGNGYKVEYSANDVSFLGLSSPASINVTFGGNIDSLATEGEAGDLRYIAGYFDSTDNGGGWFQWDETNTDSADGGSIIRPFGIAVGAWVRIFNDDVVRPEQWGIIPDVANVYTTSLTLMSLYANTNDKPIHFASGDYNIGGAVNIIAVSHLDKDVRFVGTGSIKFSNELYVEQTSNLVDTTVDLYITYKQKDGVDVRLWGVSTGVISDSSIELMDAINNSGDNELVLNTGCMISASANFSQNGKVLVFNQGAYISVDGAVGADPSFQPNLFKINSTEPVIRDRYDLCEFDDSRTTSLSGKIDVISMKLFYKNGDTIDVARYIPFCNRALHINITLNWEDLVVEFVDNASTLVSIDHIFEGAEITIASGKTVAFSSYTSCERQVFYGDGFPLVVNDVDPVHFGIISKGKISVDSSSALQKCFYVSTQSKVGIDLKGRTYYIYTPLDTYNYSADDMYTSDRKLCVYDGKIVWKGTAITAIFVVRYHGIFRNIEIVSEEAINNQLFYLQVPTATLSNYDFKEGGLHLINCNIDAENCTLFWIGTSLVDSRYVQIDAVVKDCYVKVDYITSTTVPFPNANFGTKMKLYNNTFTRPASIIYISSIYAGSQCEIVNNKFYNNFQIKFEVARCKVHPDGVNAGVILTKVTGNGFFSGTGETPIIESTALQAFTEGNDAVVKDNYNLTPSIDCKIPFTEGITNNYTLIAFSFLSDPDPVTFNHTFDVTSIVRGEDWILPKKEKKGGAGPGFVPRLYDIEIINPTADWDSGSPLSNLLLFQVERKRYTSTVPFQYYVTLTYSNNSGAVDSLFIRVPYKLTV